MFTPTTSFSNNNPNMISVVVEDIEYVGYKWALVANPDSVCRVTLASTDTNAPTTRRLRRQLEESTGDLGSHSSDETFTTYMTAYD
jgi:hypothetical protein